MEFRTLRRAEREPLLRLLDAWDVGDGWRGAAFFRRYVEGDATFRDENVLVAAEAGELAACVQIFPRTLRTAAADVPLGGIGTVYTRPDRRRAGLAEALLARAADAMRAEGRLVSLLFGARIAWYTKQGWRSWAPTRVLLERRAAAGAAPKAEVGAFDPSSDLAAVRAIHDAYSGTLPGSVVRDDALWDASLRNAGNPDEEFLVARVQGEVVAYARAVVLMGFLVVTEFGRRPGFEDPLAELFVRLQTPRDVECFERALRPSAELRRLATTVGLHFDPDLAVALGGRGFALTEHPDASCMLRCLDAPALARRVGLAHREGEHPNDLLSRVLPPGDFTFWTADRF
jgi:predicted N-acetyltransferase YhbS